MKKHLGLSIILVILGNALQSLADFPSAELSYTGFPVLSKGGKSKGKSPHSSCKEDEKGNGRCDNRNNDGGCEWDGGDCCPCSCEDGDTHDCGAQGYDCKDPDYIDCVGTSAPSGAPTSTPTEIPSPAKTLSPALTEVLTLSPINYPTPIPTLTEAPTPTTTHPPTATPIQTPNPALTYPPIPIPTTTSPSIGPIPMATAPSPTIRSTFSPSGHSISPIPPIPTSSPTSTPTYKVHVTDYPTSAPTIPSLEDYPATTPAIAQSPTMGFWAILIAAVGGIAASILDAHLSRETGNTSQALQSTVPAIGSMSIRRSSSTLGCILTSQLQFLATLSLVEYYTTEDKPWLQQFGARLRWLNLWWPASFTGDEIFQGYAEQRRLASSSTCDWEDPAFFVPIGNLVLVLAILLFILLVHLLVLSGLETNWLLEKHATEEWERAASDFMVPSPASDLQRVRPIADTDQSRGCDTSTIDAGTASVSTRWVTPTGDNETFERMAERDQEEGILVENLPRNPIVNPVIECRDQSSSAWLHFPHVELVFLFFAFEGFVAAQVYGFQQRQCLPVQIIAAVVLILYPVLMLIGICRITLVRVCSTAIIEFRWFPNRRIRSNGCISRWFISWKHDQSLFSWGDKGRWHTVQTSNECLWREGNWFRVGFGPIFMDVTQSGSWLMAIVLLEWASFACISVLVESAIVQLFAFFGLFLGAFVMLVIFRPFANKVINAIALLVTFINAATMALLAVSTVGWSGTIEVTGIYGVVTLMQLMVLLVLVVPIYVDLAAVIIAAICKKHHIDSQETSPRNEKNFVSGYIKRLWMRTWGNILGRNLCAYVKDIREGVRSPCVSLEHVKSCTYLGHAPSAAGTQERVDVLLCDTRLDDEDTEQDYVPASNSRSSNSSAASSRLPSLRQFGQYPQIVPAQDV